MVKLFCNRCTEEIKDCYYTINFNEYDIKPGSSEELTGYASSYSGTRSSILAMLNTQEMFCPKCKRQIEKFIKNTSVK